MSQHLADEIGRRVKGVTPEKDRAFHISVAHIDARGPRGRAGPTRRCPDRTVQGSKRGLPARRAHAVHIKESQGHLAYEDVRPSVFFSPDEVNQAP